MPEENIPQSSRFTGMPDVYANSVHIEIGTSEIYLTFGAFENSMMRSGLIPKVRLVMPHADFLGIMGFLNDRVKFLEVAYGGTPLNLNQVPNSQLKDALKYLGIATNDEAVASAAAGGDNDSSTS